MRRVLRPLLAALVLVACTDDVERPASPETAVEPTPATAPAGDATPVVDPLSPLPDGPIFVDRTAELGVDFTHDNGMTGRFYMPENMGAGGALLDADGDGDLDLYLVQGGPIGPGVDPAAGPQDRLYRNLLAEEGALRFEAVTGATPPSRGYGMGVATADYDGDGDVDLYRTAFGANQLLRNRGDGTFEDVTAAAGAGVDDRRWSVPATFFDADGDGDLDLFVGNYLDFTFESHRPCATRAGAPDYCGPEVYAAVPDRLLQNRLADDGRAVFVDVTATAGLDAAFGKALGAVAVDVDVDGRLELYVANDGTPNQLWRAAGDGTFVDEALFAGCAVNGDGLSEASMGVDAGDVDGDGDLDLVMSHFTGETHTLYANDGAGLFEDATPRAGFGAASLAANGFGAGLRDVDGDGVLDLAVVNGAVLAVEALARAGDPYPYAQPNQLFRGIGGGRFEEISDRAGDAFVTPHVSRGALFGDLDDDGDVDLVVTNNRGPAQILLNAVGQDRPWIGARLVHVDDPPRAALGARAALERPGRPLSWRRVATDGGYASGHDPRLLFAVAPGETAVDLRVVWPGGDEERFPGLAPGRYHLLRRGEGTP